MTVARVTTVINSEDLVRPDDLCSNHCIRQANVVGVQKVLYMSCLGREDPALKPWLVRSLESLESRFNLKINLKFYKKQIIHHQSIIRFVWKAKWWSDFSETEKSLFGMFGMCAVCMMGRYSKFESQTIWRPILWEDQQRRALAPTGKPLNCYYCLHCRWSSFDLEHSEKLEILQSVHVTLWVAHRSTSELESFESNRKRSSKFKSNRGISQVRFYQSFTKVSPKFSHILQRSRTIAQFCTLHSKVYRAKNKWPTNGWIWILWIPFERIPLNEYRSVDRPKG